MKKTKIVITIFACSIAILHIIRPQLSIDAITIGFLLLAILPWISSIIKSVEIPGFGKIELQQEIAREAISPGKEIEKQLLLNDNDGFYTKKGISYLIEKSDYMGKDEKIVESILIFRTKKQRTWIIATNKNVFCILDDETTRKNLRLIQWYMPLALAKPIHAGYNADNVPVLQIGPRTNWIYSDLIFTTPDKLETSIKCIIE
jgi:hypothetical protein